jgi:transcription initiation factor TFIIIB Brf1 subunit/transcription initiation factor TFIIB
MAASLYCPNCGEYHGKASENDESVYCGNCGETFENEYYEYYN